MSEYPTEEFRVEVGNGQVLVIRGPVRDIEPGERYLSILNQENSSVIKFLEHDPEVGAVPPNIEDLALVHIPVSEARLDVEEVDEDDD